MENHLHTIPVRDWLKSPFQPLLISGPCSVETEEQFVETAKLLAATGRVNLLRGGLWKPRTRPNSFEGVGAIGLEWMVRARAETGLKLTTEVATAEHVELCLKHGIDVLWIGARTTVNPFSVQEIADALKGVDIPVIVKNPVNPDLQLWIGALERIYQSGITKLVAMHRGFSHFGDSIYRNKPMWEIPIALKTQYPQLSIFCDPSHICGRRDLLLQVAQKALDLGMDGLMLESHLTPDQAWSDAKQQVTPHALVDLLDQLQVRATSTDDRNFVNELHALRSRIDKVDEEIIQLIAKRMNITQELGRYKRDHNITILQVDRWKEIIDTRTMLADKLGLTREFIMHYLEQLHKESIRTQTRIMNEENGDIASQKNATDSIAP
ncbi:MAG: bifunctional 3-deoxy-7-phosphoheptulonate synthase/chorismate mutase type II [Flavobacteriales bacterium]|nr:bifunctional 3-deoxy-7-phosphoheptulonate synthase/chorismate mutase type II [Flavobacteriales bacterium]